MRDYAKVAPQFWIGKTGRQIRKLGPNHVTVAMYLMTCQHANMLGLYYLPIAYLEHETSVGIEGPSEGLGRGFQGAREVLRSLENVGFCRYDDESEMVWVVEMAKFQIAPAIESTDKRAKGIVRMLEDVPFTELTEAFLYRYVEPFNLNPQHLSEGASKGLRRAFEGAYKALRSQEQEQEQDTGTGKNPPTPLCGQDDDFVSQAEQVAQLHPEDQELFWLWKRRQQRLAIRYHAEGAYTDAELAEQLNLLDYDRPQAPIGVNHLLAEKRLGDARFRPIWREERERVTYLRYPEDAPDGFLPRDVWDERVEARLVTN